MLRVITSNGYFLARRDIVRESISFCSTLSSAMRKIYLRACEKTMLSLHLSEWMEWKCTSAAQSVGFLCRVVESLRCAPKWIFMSRKDISWVEYSEVIVGWTLFMKSFMDWSCLVVPLKIRKMSSMNLFQKGRDPDEGFANGFFMTPHELVGIWWGNLGSHGCASKLEKLPAHE